MPLNLKAPSVCPELCLTLGWAFRSLGMGRRRVPHQLSMGELCQCVLAGLKEKSKQV